MLHLVKYYFLLSDPLVKLLMGALKESGCPINIRRHIVCENCETVVTGGYDQELNQIVVCQNMANGRKMPDSTLIHELIHMYDYCVNHIDFRNLEHLACTEIRAANLSHCSFISSWLLGQSSPINIRNTHQVRFNIFDLYSYKTIKTEFLVYFFILVLC